MSARKKPTGCSNSAVEVKKNVWAAFVSSNGLFLDDPVACVWDETCWKALPSGRIVFRTGMSKQGSLTIFASYNKDAVKSFILGVKEFI